MRNRRLLDLLGLALAVLVVVSSILHDWQTNVAHGERQFAVDLGTFYCGGAAVSAHGDLYKTIPYDRCGDGNQTRPARWEHRAPAPIPGYDVPLFEALAKLSFPAAAAVWLVLSIVAAVAGVLAIAAVSGLPAVVVFLAVANGLRESLTYGQLSPILLGALGVAGYSLYRKRPVLAAAAAIVTLIEPHVGVPVVITMLILAPRTRVVLVAGSAALAVLSIIILGLAENLEYFRYVLPAQVLAEVPGDAQYSLTWLLYFLGVDELTAIRIAEAQYAIIVLAGIFAARALASRLDSPALIPFVAASFAVIGGPFIHLFQVGTIAVLTPLVLAGRRNVPAAWIAVALVAASWDGNGAWLDRPWTIARFESALIFAMFVIFAWSDRRRLPRIALGIAAAVAFLLATSTILHTSLHQVRTLDSPAQFLSKTPASRAYSTTEWGLYLRTSKQNPSREALLAKSPTWIGLICLIFAVVRVVRKDGSVGQPFAIESPAFASTTAG